MDISGTKTPLYCLMGEFKTVSGKRDELVEILGAAVEAVRRAPGRILYVVGVKPDDPDAVVVWEAWSSKEDHDRSLENDAVQALIGRARPLLAGTPSGHEVTPIYGVGL